MRLFKIGLFILWLITFYGTINANAEPIHAVQLFPDKNVQLGGHGILLTHPASFQNGKIHPLNISRHWASYSRFNIKYFEDSLSSFQMGVEWELDSLSNIQISEINLLPLLELRQESKAKYFRHRLRLGHLPLSNLGRGLLAQDFDPLGFEYRFGAGSYNAMATIWTQGNTPNEDVFNIHMSWLDSIIGISYTWIFPYDEHVVSFDLGFNFWGINTYYEYGVEYLDFFHETNVSRGFLVGTNYVNKYLELEMQIWNFKNKLPGVDGSSNDQARMYYYNSEPHPLRDYRPRGDVWFYFFNTKLNSPVIYLGTQFFSEMSLFLERNHWAFVENSDKFYKAPPYAFYSIGLKNILSNGLVLEFLLTNKIYGSQIYDFEKPKYTSNFPNSHFFALKFPLLRMNLKWEI